MKPHLVIGTVAGAATVTPRSWMEVIRDKQGVGDRLHPRIDELLRRFGVPVWVTAEYPRQGETWTSDEVASGLNRIYRLILREPRSIPAALIRAIRLLPLVRFARLGSVGHAILPATQMGSTMPRGSRLGRPAAAIGLEQAWEFTRGDNDVTVAVIDTGVDGTHRELSGRLEPGHDFVDILDGAKEFIGDFTGADPEPEDEVGHGTHVSGIIVGRGLKMAEGVAPECRILPVRALAAMRRGRERVGAGLVDNINSAIKWAIDQGADIINMSLGVRHESGGLPHEEVVDYARRKGVSIVAASGNDGTRQLYFPGALPHVIAVGAADANGQVAGFSTYGDHVSLIAPGEDIYSSYVGGRYAFASGTSQASPFVSGVAALLKSYARSQGRELTDNQLKRVLRQTADRIDTRFKNPKAGFGCLNAADAMRWLDHRLNEPEPGSLSAFPLRAAA
jgi:subtilisin family serine protease